jgi:hypothetical protein
VPLASFQLVSDHIQALLPVLTPFSPAQVQKKLADAHTEATLGLVSAIQLGRLKDAGTWARQYCVNIV